MKNKILEALKQEYKTLGLADEVFERVASSVETFITEEAQIPNFVKGAEGLLKAYQSTGDKARGEAASERKKAEQLQAEIDALKAKYENNGGSGEGGSSDPNKAIADAVAAAVASAIKPLQDKIDSYEGSANAKEAVNNARSSFFGNDYVKKYEVEGKDAWERAAEINAATGSKMTAEELSAKAMGYFNSTVQRLGVDTSKPLQGEGDPNETTDWSAEKKRLQETGRIPKA